MLAIAHRTPRSAPGCARLAALGVRVFEVDLQFLAGVPVVSHHLPLLPGLPWLRHDRWRFTVRARAATEEDLAAVLDRIPAGRAVLVDLKSEDPDSVAATAELLRAVGPDHYVSGKGVAGLELLRDAGHRVWLSVSTRRALAAALAGDLPAGLHALTVRHTYLDAAVVGRLREHVPRVMAWTVRDVRRAAELAAAGVAGITSDSAAVHGFTASRPGPSSPPPGRPASRRT